MSPKTPPVGRVRSLAGGRPPARRHHRRIAATTAAVAAAFLLASCSSNAASPQPTSPVGASSASGKPVVTPDAARSVVGPTMSTNNRANDRLDSSLLATYEGGSAYAIDHATYLGELDAKHEAHFAPSNTPFTLLPKAIGLARQTTWPAQFVAVGPTKTLSKNAPKGPACASLLDFERTGSNGHWRIVLEPTAPSGAVPSFDRSAKGYDRPLSLSRIHQAEALPQKVVKALVTEETSGKLGPFARSDFSRTCGALPDPRLDVVDAERSGLSARDLYSVAAPADTAAYPLAGGKTLVMFTLRFDDEVIGGSSGPVSWSHPSLSKNPAQAWTYLLPAGSYSEVHEHGDLELAAVLSPGGHYSVIGAYDGIVRVTGTKASASGTTPQGTLTAASSFTG